MKVNIKDDILSWKTAPLLQFLEEGNVPSGWKDFFERPDVWEELVKVSAALDADRKRIIFYPQLGNVFRAFYENPPESVRAIILGMDPYHNGKTEHDGSAVGLCFSVRKGNDINPSLRNIYSELANEGFKPNQDGDLSHWSKQGVFMLNTALTVEKGSPDSHTAVWYNFTEMVLQHLANTRKHTVWILLGKKAEAYAPIIKGTTNKAVVATHPSPFSAMKASGTAPAFIGSGVFKRANDILAESGHHAIEW